MSEGVSEVSGASKRANGRASGPVLTSVFFSIFDHSAGRERNGEKRRRRGIQGAILDPWSNVTASQRQRSQRQKATINFEMNGFFVLKEIPEPDEEFRLFRQPFQSHHLVHAHRRSRRPRRCRRRHRCHGDRVALGDKTRSL